MITVYMRVLEYEKLNPKFQFNQKGLQLVGFLTRNEWLRQGGRLEQLDSNWHQERNGNFMVFEYPASFLPTIDQVIVKYVQRVISKGINKRKHGKPKTSEQQNQAVPSSSHSHRKRKRIPVDKPAFSGRNLKK